MPGNLHRTVAGIEDVYTTAMEFDASNNLIYLGLTAQGSAKSAATWQIRKFTYDASNNPLDIQFAGASDAFSSIWDNRAALTYS